MLLIKLQSYDLIVSIPALRVVITDIAAAFNLSRDAIAYGNKADHMRLQDSITKRSPPQLVRKDCRDYGKAPATSPFMFY